MLSDGPRVQLALYFKYGPKLVYRKTIKGHLNEAMSKEEKQGLEEGTVNVLLASQQDETAALS